MSLKDHFRPERLYFDSATMGLTPVRAAREIQLRTEEMVSGTSNPLVFDDYIRRSRSAYATIVDAPQDWISIIPAVSSATAVLASYLSEGQRVLVAEEDFTSVLFPLLQAQQRGVEVLPVPLAELLDRIDDAVDWVAVSAVQSRDGRLIDLDALADACARCDVRSYVDLTQAAGWLEVGARRFDMTSAGAYKWLLSPRGSGFMSVSPSLWPDMPPVAPGWYAGEQPWESIYSPPLRLAANARRYDTSPAWLCWAGAAISLELIAEAGVASIGRHNTQLASQFSLALGGSSSESAIASLALSPQQIDAGRSSGLVFSERGGTSRFSFHAYNTADEVETAFGILRAAA